MFLAPRKLSKQNSKQKNSDSNRQRHCSQLSKQTWGYTLMGHVSPSLVLLGLLQSPKHAHKSQTYSGLSQCHSRHPLQEGKSNPDRVQLPHWPHLLKQPFSQIYHQNLLYLNLHVWHLDTTQNHLNHSLSRWQRELRHLKDPYLENCMSQGGPFWNSGANRIRLSAQSLLSQTQQIILTIYLLSKI